MFYKSFMLAFLIQRFFCIFKRTEKLTFLWYFHFCFKMFLWSFPFHYFCKIHFIWIEIIIGYTNFSHFLHVIKHIFTCKIHNRNSWCWLNNLCLLFLIAKGQTWGKSAKSIIAYLYITYIHRNIKSFMLLLSSLFRSPWCWI